MSGSGTNSTGGGQPPGGPSNAKLGVAASGGAVAGAGALALFTNLGLDKIIQQQAGYGAFYVMTIFSLVALVVLGTSYIVVQRQDATSRLSVLPLLMIAIFGMISIGGVALFGYDFARDPVITVPGYLEPQVLSFTDPDKIQPVTLKAVLLNPGVSSAEQALGDAATPYQLRRDRPFVIKLVNFDALERKYQQQAAALQALREADRRLLNNFGKLCDALQAPANDQVCVSIKLLVNDAPLANPM